MSKCPVCKSECEDNYVCQECGFDNINPVFLSKEDAATWMDEVVLPFRIRYWALQRDFEICGNRLVKYLGKSETVVVPYGIEVIDYDAFAFNNYVHSVYLPDTIREISDFAFECARIKSIYLPEGLKRIGSHAFACSDLLCVTIPGSCTEIGDNAFASCTMLQTITLSRGVKYVGEEAFLWCDQVTSIMIPETVVQIGMAAFSVSCEELFLSVDPQNKRYCAIRNNLVDKVEKKLLSGCISNGIPFDQTIRIIGSGAFMGGISSDEVLSIPSNIESIEEKAFNDCDIRMLYIPRTVKKVGNLAVCGGENGIICCDVKRRPSTWHPDWYDKNCHQVFWGNKWKTVNGRPEVILLDHALYSATLTSYEYYEGQEQLKLKMNLYNRSSTTVRFKFRNISLDYDESTFTYWCDVDANSEKICTSTIDESDFYALSIGAAKKISFRVDVEDTGEIYSLAQGEQVALIGFATTENSIKDDEELPF